MIRERFIGICLCLGLSLTGLGQQDLQSSTYFLSPMIFNSAYAGSRGTMNVQAVNRAQWVGWQGAPRSQIFSVNAPILGRRVGIGASYAVDAVGGRSQSTSMIHAAYHLPLDDEGTRLSFGVSGGGISNGYHFQELRAEDEGDPVYLGSYRGRAGNFGAGCYLLTDGWYAGIGIPHLVRKPLVGEDSDSPMLQRHVYVMGGYSLEDRGPVSIQLSGLLKVTAHAPALLEVRATAWAFDLVGLGAMLRWNEGLGFHASYQLADEVQVVYAVDLPMNRLRTRNFGSHEIALLFDVSRRRDAYQSPRYF